ncbi:Crinkler (CRN) [Phytophthora megakarya]|uniref:Crinkler (CRN) n=1 Tax=Phytophthora megakarya TaxID=4795 RepID=A0A225WTP4_9STRA|nr:Crinkler (CRN) [Phytophthora megakarya]
MYYELWRLIKDKERVLFFSKKGPIFNQQFWSPDLWCLVDTIDPTGMTGLPVDDCSVLLASTPRRDCISEFKKLAPTPDVFYCACISAPDNRFRHTTEPLKTILPHICSKWIQVSNCRQFFS